MTFKLLCVIINILTSYVRIDIALEIYVLLMMLVHVEIKYYVYNK